MKSLHRMIVLSATYRQSSVLPNSATAQPSANSLANAAADPENRFLWRMNSRRMEAEVVRDSLLFVAGSLDLTTRGGPEISESEAQSNLRRSLYFRSTPNEKAGFLETFDAANPNECYRRQDSVIPQQALALMNSRLALDHARILSETLTHAAGEGDTAEIRAAFIAVAFETILNRAPTAAEVDACQKFLERNAATTGTASLAVFPAGGQSSQRARATVPYLRTRENLVHVLLSHNDFVTIR